MDLALASNQNFFHVGAITPQEIKATFVLKSRFTWLGTGITAFAIFYGLSESFERRQERATQTFSEQIYYGDRRVRPQNVLSPTRGSDSSVFNKEEIIVAVESINDGSSKSSQSPRFDRKAQPLKSILKK